MYRVADALMLGFLAACLGAVLALAVVLFVL